MTDSLKSPADRPALTNSDIQISLGVALAGGKLAASLVADPAFMAKSNWSGELAARVFRTMICESRNEGSQPIRRSVVMGSSYSREAFDSFATLAGLFIQFGGDPTEVLKDRSVWVRVQIGNEPAPGASECVPVVEVADGFFRDMAALAAKLENLLVEHAGHPLTGSLDTEHG